MATATLQLGRGDHGRAMSLDDYLGAEVERNYRCELARGVLEITEIPDESHGMIVDRLRRALHIYGLARPEVIRRHGGAGEYHFILPTLASGRNPDLAATLRGTPKDLRDHRPASFAVEVVSEGAEARERDYLTKRQEYLAYGLRESWIVDPIGRKVTILVRDGDAWSERVVAGDGSAEGLALPGLVVPLASLWAGDEESADAG